MSPDKIDRAIQLAVNNLKDEQMFTASSPDVLDLISKSNIDAKQFAIRLVQETMYQLFPEAD